MIVIRRIGVVSSGKLLAVVSGGLGLLTGLLLSVIGFLAALLGDSYLSFETFGTIFTLVCLMPVIYAAAGFVFGAAAAFLANLALRFGGFDLEAELREKPAPPPAVPVQTLDPAKAKPARKKRG